MQAVQAACVEWPDVHFTVLGDCALLAERAAAVQVDWTALQATGRVACQHEALRARSAPGQLNAANSHYVLALLDRAIDGALSGEFDALVTAPLQKRILLEADIPFTGHTEYLAQRTGAARAVMMLAGRRTFRVALATTHLPLKEVSAALNTGGLLESLRIIDMDLRRYFEIAAPRILVSGLNPHAGEGGYLGHEDIEVIAPAVSGAREAGMDARGPYPADTLFTPRMLDGADCVLAMYHDQGLPTLKYAAFGKSVNITLGLPIVRTSVDHGTALDLAGTGRADPGSLMDAIGSAIEIARRCRRPQPRNRP